MWVNPKLMSRLAESYSNGEMMRAYSGGGNNHFNNSYNNYRGDENWINNNNEGVNQINSFTGNPEGLKQQQRFNEITNQWLPAEQAQITKSNQGLLNFANNLSNSFNGVNGNVYPVQQHQQIPQEMKTAYAESINDPTNQYQKQLVVSDNQQQQIASNNITIPSKEGFDIDYSTERKFRNGTLTNDIINKQTTMALIVICVIGFILFMLVQLYMSQKRLEYMFHIYRDISINSPYYQAER